MSPRRHRNGPQLTLIRGGLEARTERAGVQVEVAALDAPAPRLDAVVVEDDTWTVLSADPQLNDPGMPLERALQDAERFQPYAPGTLVVREEEPLELLAIIHDLDATPSWREEWIATALEAVFTVAADRVLGTVAMPLLGTIHGRLEPERAIALLCNALDHQSGGWPRKLWLAVPRKAVRPTLAQIEGG